MFDSDASGDLHANEIPIELLQQHGGAEQDAVELKGKLDVAEGVIRKLYAKSMETTNENAALRCASQPPSPAILNLESRTLDPQPRHASLTASLRDGCAGLRTPGFWRWSGIDRTVHKGLMTLARGLAQLLALPSQMPTKERVGEEEEEEEEGGC